MSTANIFARVNRADFLVLRLAKVSIKANSLNIMGFPRRGRKLYDDMASKTLQDLIG